MVSHLRPRYLVPLLDLHLPIKLANRDLRPGILLPRSDYLP